MRNMTGATTARVLSEIYREKSGEIDSRTSRTARGSLEQDSDRDAGGGAGRAAERVEQDAA
jgi:hypothetical protein